MSDPPVPGWYNDPYDPALVRWWDGTGWTDATQPRPGAQSPPGGGRPEQPASHSQPQASAHGQQPAAEWQPGQPAGAGGESRPGSQGRPSSRVLAIFRGRLWGAPRAVWAGAAGLVVVVLIIVIAVIVPGNGTPGSKAAACHKMESIGGQGFSLAGGTAGSSSSGVNVISQMRQFLGNYQEAAQLAPSGSALQHAIQNFTNAANDLITDLQDNNASRFSADFSALGRYGNQVASICGIPTS
jgi:hypothetical protein